MIKLYDNGVYLLNGTEILEDTGNVSLPVSKEEAAKNTIESWTVIILQAIWNACRLNLIN